MSTDLSFLDLLTLFDKQDPVVNEEMPGKIKMKGDDLWMNLEEPEKSSKIETDESPKQGRVPVVDALESALRENGVDLSSNWELESDDFLRSILNGDQISMEDPGFTALSVDDLLDIPSQVDSSIPPSNASDSGMSSDYSHDQQLSPLFPEEEQPSPRLYADNLSETSLQQNDQLDAAASPLLVDEGEQTLMLDPASLGEVKVEDNEAIISMDILETPEMKQIPVQTLMKNPLPANPVIKVTPVTSTVNPRSILLPITLKDLKDVNTIRIINSGPVLTSNLKTLKTSIKPAVISSVVSQSVAGVTGTRNTTCSVVSPAQTVDSVADKQESGNTSREANRTEYPELHLIDEEIRLLKKENLQLPTHYPLTKQEERDLKRIRRKIRNKISAQDSRKRKKEYMDGLEDRVKKCTETNIHLQKRINVLENQNRTLLSQLKRLQGLVTSGRAAQTSTCLMVLILSFALFLVPSLRPGQNRNQAGESQEGDLSIPDVKMPPMGGRSRSLLSKNPFTDLYKNEAGDFDVDNDKSLMSKVKQAIYNPLDDHDYEPPSKIVRIKEEPIAGKDEYIIPPIDDEWPTQGKEDKFILEHATEERYVNVSDSGGMRTVVLQVPKDL